MIFFTFIWINHCSSNSQCIVVIFVQRFFAKQEEELLYECAALQLFALQLSWIEKHVQNSQIIAKFHCQHSGVWIHKFTCSAVHRKFLLVLTALEFHVTSYWAEEHLKLFHYEHCSHAQVSNWPRIDCLQVLHSWIEEGFDLWHQFVCEGKVFLLYLRVHIYSSHVTIVNQVLMHDSSLEEWSLKHSRPLNIMLI